MSRIMFDSITPQSVKNHFVTGDLAAGYNYGTYDWGNGWNLFPAQAWVAITPSVAHIQSDVLDVETGDATPTQTYGWIHAKKAAGYYRPTIYCNLATVPAVRAGTGPYVLGKDYDLWIADWDGNQSLPYPLAVAKQYSSFTDVDVSIVFDDQWPYRTLPVPPVPPVPPQPVPPSFRTSVTIIGARLDLSWGVEPGAVQYIVDWFPHKGGMHQTEVTTSTSLADWDVSGIGGKGAVRIASKDDKGVVTGLKTITV